MWQTIRLGDVCTISSSKRIFAKEYQTEGIPFYRGKEVIEKHNGNKVSTELFISPKRYEEIKGKYEVPKKGDILLTSVGTLGIPWLVDEDDFYFKDGNLTWLRCNTQILPSYLYLWLNSAEAQNQIDVKCIGSTQKALTIETLNKFQITLPSLELQKKIVAVINPIESRININRSVTENLEQQAVVLFRSWFSAFSLSPNSHRVNSEFGEIPEDFTVIKVGSLPILVTDYVSNGSFASLKANVSLYQEPNYAYFIRNTDLKSGSFGVFVDQHSYEFLSKSTLYGGEIIISNVGDVGSVFLCPKLDAHMTLGNNIIMLRPEDDHLRYYLYIWFKYLQGQALIQGIKGGSAQPKFNKTDFKNTSILIPPKDILSRFHETVAPMFEMISHRQTETSRLANLRDTLLPHLMSGEIDVSKLDI